MSGRSKAVNEKIIKILDRYAELLEKLADLPIPESHEEIELAEWLVRQSDVLLKQYGAINEVGLPQEKENKKMNEDRLAGGDKSRLSEIKARAEAAEAPYVDDVPFLLEQLKTWRMTSAVFEKAAESAQAKLAASEAATGQMVEALEMIMERSDEGSRFHSACEAALATDAGKGWLSPEEAARQKAEIRKLHALRIEDGQEAERLRKELEQRETHHKELHNANEQLSASLTSADNRYYLLLDATEKGGLVSEEECARRCREVAEDWQRHIFSPGKVVDRLGGPHLTAIIDRVAKGGE